MDVPPSVCGPRTDVVCTWVYERTDGSAVLAQAADWLVGRPLAVLGLLASGWALRWLVRRLARRVVGRILAAQQPFFVVPPAPASDGSFTAVLPSVDDARRETRAHAVSNALSSLLSALVWTVVLISVTAVLGLDLAPLIASAGLAGVALAFGAQSLIQDLLGGVFILLEDHFGIGDEVEIGEVSGTVETITLRQTVLRDIDGTAWHIRNGDIRRVGNHSQVWSAALLDVEVARDADIARAIEALQAAGDSVTSAPAFATQILERPDVLGVQALTPDGITLRLRVRTSAGRQFELQRALLEAIEATFRDAGVARSTRVVAVTGPAGAQPGDHSGQNSGTMPTATTRNQSTSGSPSRQ